MKIKIVDVVIIIILWSLVIFSTSHFDTVMSQVNGIYRELFSDQGQSFTKENQKLAPQKIELSQNRIRELLRENAMMQRNTPPVTRDVENPDDKAMLDEAVDNLYHAVDAYDRELAVMILGEFSHPTAMRGILYALNDTESMVRERAITEIRKWGDEQERAQMFIIALDNGKPEIVVLALESIPEFQDRALRAKIETLSHGNNQSIREAAQTALEIYAAE